MGDLFGEGLGEYVHSVTVSDFYLGKTEVTFDEYDAYCLITGHGRPSDFGWGRAQRPVIEVDWYDAVEYCNWRSLRAGRTPVYSIDKNTKDPNNKNSYDDKKWIVTVDKKANGYRLPTEAEWEYAACEGGKKVRFGNGQDVADPEKINFKGSEDLKTSYSLEGVYRRQTVPAGSLQAPNALGLHDMSGNVWEWCFDWYGAYPSGAAVNPTGSESGTNRVVRGGSYYDGPQYCRIANRGNFNPNNGGGNFGFRLAVSTQ